VPGQAVDGLAGALGRAGSLFVGMSTRHWPGMHEVTAAVVSGELGEILSYTDRVGFRLGGDSLPPWYFERETLGGGVLLTNGVHALDRARAMLGGLSLVSARLTRVFPDHDCDDIAELRLETSSGAPVGLSIMWLPYQPTATGITVVGTAGTASVAMDGSWSVTTTTGVRTGAAIDLDTVPFEAQWAAFVAAQPGFGLGDLEPTLATIDEIYEGASRD
jgi:predicted dehydrogenase